MKDDSSSDHAHFAQHKLRNKSVHAHVLGHKAKHLYKKLWFSLVDFAPRSQREQFCSSISVEYGFVVLNAIYPVFKSSFGFRTQ